MACYYKVNESQSFLPLYKGFHLQKVKKSKVSGPQVNYDFSKHVLIELLDDTTSESKIWSELGLTNNKNIIHKRLMIDPHRIKCRRAVVVCINSDEAKLLAESISQTKIMSRCVCAVVMQDLLSDLCLFEKQIIQFGDSRPQQQLLYVSDLNRCREPSGLVKFLRETFSPFGTILSVLVCSDEDGYAYPEGVIKFAYLSEAFAAELAFDQYVLGKERLSVTTHHNILLSQCDLRVRLRDAQWQNNATLSESHFGGLNDLSASNESSIVYSINNLQISSKSVRDTRENTTLKQVNLSFGLTGDEQCNRNLSQNNFDDDLYNLHNNSDCYNSLSLSKMNETAVPIFSGMSKYNGESKNMDLSDKSNVMHKSMSLTDIDSRSGCSNNQFVEREECSLKTETHQEYSVKQDSKTKSSCNSYVSCLNVPDPHCLSSVLSLGKRNVNRLHSQEISAATEYFSVSSDHQQSSGVRKGSDVNWKPSENKSMKRRKHFTSSQKLCLKSQRIGLSQESINNIDSKSKVSSSSSTPSGKSPKGHKKPCKKHIGLFNVSPKVLSSLPDDPDSSSKVTSWLSQLPSSQNNAFTGTEESESANEKPQSFKVKQNRISVHETPFVKRSRTNFKNAPITFSDSSSVENDDPNMDALLFSDENLESLILDKFQTPMQAWLKQELMLSTLNNVTKSKGSAKSVIVCAAKTKDVIISVGCSHMTCESCYLESTDLLLGYC